MDKQGRARRSKSNWSLRVEQNSPEHSRERSPERTQVKVAKKMRPPTRSAARVKLEKALTALRSRAGRSKGCQDLGKHIKYPDPECIAQLIRPLLPDRNAPTSPLLRLPAELRLQIYAYVFSGVPNPHFHVTEKVYPSCTYSKPPRALEHPVSAAILQVCRTVYFEAIEVLYARTTLKLVLFAGSARCGYKHNVAEYPCLGDFEECGMLSRIRRATIEVRPGKSPNADRYVRRARRLVKALQLGSSLKEVEIRFVFPYFLSAKACRIIVGAFEGLIVQNLTLRLPLDDRDTPCETSAQWMKRYKSRFEEADVCS